MQFLDILSDALYLFIVLVVIGAVIFIFVIYAVIMGSLGVHIDLHTVVYSAVILFSVLIIALAIVIIFYYIPQMLHEREETV